jgi:gold/copper resistance efflux system membrane fusion protein
MWQFAHRWFRRRSCSLGTLLVCLGCGRPLPPLVEVTPPAVTVATPVARAVTEFVEFTGNAAAVEMVEIKARVSGFITKVHFADGQNLQAGSPLFDIDDRPYRIARDQAAAEVAKSVAELKELENEVVRDKSLLPRAAISQEQYEIVVARRDMSQAMLDKARATLAQAELDLGFCHVESPLTGRVSTRRVTVGDLVSGATGSATPLTVVVNTNPIYVVFNADERSLLLSRERAIADRRAGAAADDAWRNIKDLAIPVDVGLVTDEGYPYRGVLDFVDVAVKAATGTVRCRAILANPDGLIAPGMFVRARMPFGSATPSLLVADRAIGTDQSRKYVAVVGPDNRIEHRTIRPTFIDGGLRVVADGLHVADRVVIAGLQRAREGAVVRPTEAPMQP